MGKKGKRETRKNWKAKHPEGRKEFARKKKEAKRIKMHAKGEVNW